MNFKNVGEILCKTAKHNTGSHGKCMLEECLNMFLYGVVYSGNQRISWNAFQDYTYSSNEYSVFSFEENVWENEASSGSVVT